MRRNIPALLGTLGLGLIVGVSAPAQATAVQPAGAEEAARAPDTFVVTVREGVPMRCRADSIWYVVARLDEGQVLRVMGENEGWLEVEYPPDVPAIARAENVEIRENDAGAEVAVLRRTSRLFARNLDNPTRDESYTRIFSQGGALEAGTVLPVLGTVEQRGGGLGGYLVDPPRGASGFIQPLAENIRPATEAEIVAFLEASGWGQEAEDEPVEQDDAVEEDAPGASEPAADEDEAPAQDEPATDDDGAETEEANDEQEAVDPFERAERRLEALDEAFERVVRQPVETQEVAPLMEAYRDLRASLPEGDVSELFAGAIDTRLELLAIREDLQRVMREAADLEERVATTPDTEAVRRSASLGYEAVGRLMPSLIYDGDDLPLLYRVVSVDGVVGRTLAYVAPVEGMELGARVGSIVGVEGEATTEQDRRVPIIRPERVDVLRSTSE